MCSSSASLDFLPVIHETDKVRVELLEDRVVKTFKPQPGATRRFRRELRALRRLSGAEGFPRLLAFSEQERSITESRIPGVALTECDEIPESAYASLRLAVETMLDRGVARHALPPHDILLLPNGQVAIVDFERTTFCWSRLCPIWRIASVPSPVSICCESWARNVPGCSPVPSAANCARVFSSAVPFSDCADASAWSAPASKRTVGQSPPRPRCVRPPRPLGLRQPGDNAR